MSAGPRALSFGQMAEEYDRWRPSYPDAAVDWLAPSAPASVVEIGAGTGRLTSLLVARGLNVDAVEPDPRMRAVLQRNVPGARCHAVDSTALPVADGSADAVLVADAWHWFDPVATMEEVRRVLRPGGWLGLVWNVVAEPVEQWERSLDGPDMYDRSTKGGPEGVRRRLPLAAPDELEFDQFDWVWDLSPRTGRRTWRPPRWPSRWLPLSATSGWQRRGTSSSACAMRRDGRPCRSATGRAVRAGPPPRLDPDGRRPGCSARASAGDLCAEGHRRVAVDGLEPEVPVQGQGSGVVSLRGQRDP